MLLETCRIDLLTSVMEHNADEKENMTDQEVILNASPFVAANIETFTMLLSALTYLLTRVLRVMEKLCSEIRKTFLNESSITVQSVGQQQFLMACIYEAPRIFLPLPEGLPLMIPSEGEEICGA